MPQIQLELQLDAVAYESEVIETNNGKTGFFIFDNREMTVKVSFVADEYGNVESIELSEATDAYGEPATLTIDDDDYQRIADQIEPHLWGDDDTDTSFDHGMTNSDFLYGYPA